MLKANVTSTFCMLAWTKKIKIKSVHQADGVKKRKRGKGFKKNENRERRRKKKWIVFPLK